MDDTLTSKIPHSDSANVPAQYQIYDVAAKAGAGCYQANPLTHKVHGTKICSCFNGLLDGQEKQRTIDCDRSLGNIKVDKKE